MPTHFLFNFVSLLLLNIREPTLQFGTEVDGFGRNLGRSAAGASVGATYSGSLRFFFRARFRAKACFARRFAPGFR